MTELKRGDRVYTTEDFERFGDKKIPAGNEGLIIGIKHRTAVVSFDTWYRSRMFEVPLGILEKTGTRSAFMKANKMEPRVIEDNDRFVVYEYGYPTIRLDKCPECGKLMHSAPRTLKYPIQKLDVREKRRVPSYDDDVNMVHGDYKYICDQCLNEGKVFFTCYHCQERQPTDQIQDYFGDSDVGLHFLCMTCYETLPASQYDAIVKKLRDMHRWDYD